MALWLDLIPKIHRSDSLDERFHLLDGFDDLTRFDASGVDLVELEAMRRVYWSSTVALNVSTASRPGLQIISLGPAILCRLWQRCGIILDIQSVVSD